MAAPLVFRRQTVRRINQEALDRLKLHIFYDIILLLEYILYLL